MSAAHRAERRLAVVTNWGFFGSFGLCLALTGFSSASLVAGLAGFGLLVLGFGAHVLINHIFASTFSEGEVALEFVAFTVSVLCFVASWTVTREFGIVEIAIGLLGFSALIACFVFYMAANHGVRGSIAMLDEIRRLPGARRP